MDKLEKPADANDARPSAAQQPARPSISMAVERGVAARQIHRSLRAWRSEGDGEEPSGEGEQSGGAASAVGSTQDGGEAGGENGADGDEGEEPQHKKVAAKLQKLSRKIYRDDTPGTGGAAGGAAGAGAGQPKHPLVVRLLGAGFTETDLTTAKTDKAMQQRMLAALDPAMGHDKLLEALGLPPEPAEPKVENAMEVVQAIQDGNYGWTAKYTLEALDNDTLRAVIKVKLIKGPRVTDEDVERVKGEATTGVATYWNNKYKLTDKAENKTYPLAVTVSFVDSGEHVAVNLIAGPGPDNLTEWYVGGTGRAITRAHELGHQMGLKDEYVDDSANAPAARNTGGAGVRTDHSIMGNYYTEGIGNVEAKDRHGQALAAVLNTATGSRMEGARA